MDDLIDYIYENDHTIGFCGHDLPSDALEEILMLGYREGVKDGLRRFARWKDGIQYVDSYGTTLEQALKELKDV